MRTLSVVAFAVAAMAASPSLAQQDPAGAAAAKATPGPAPTHEMCQAVMGRKMQPRPIHEHSRDKSGVALWPNGKPLTKAEMAKLHKECAEKMAQGGAAAKPPPKP